MKNKKENLLPSLSEYRKKKRVKKYICFGVITSIIILIIIYNLIRASKKISSIQILAKNSEIKKPLTDRRTYEIIKLKNGLSITLISDPSTERAGLSLTSFLGKNNKKCKFYGLSQILQKSFFTEEHSHNLKQFFINHSGKLKYNIDENVSNYYFEIDADFFREAVVKFGSVIFTKPNMYDKDKVKIFSDIKKVFSNEDNRGMLISYIMARYYFELQEDIQKGDVVFYSDESEVVNYYNELYNIFYSPENVKIAMISKFSIYEMKKISFDAFSQYEKRKLKSKENILEINSPIPLERISLSKFIWHKPLSNVLKKYRIMIFPEDFDYGTSLSAIYYVCYMLDGRRPGSLQFDLKNREFASNVEVNVKRSILFGNSIVIDISLTDEGFRRLELVLQISLNYFRKIFEDPNIEITYNDFTTIMKKKFEYTTIDKYESYLSKITHSMLYSKSLGDIFFNEYNVKPFNRDYLHSLREKLDPAHTVQFLESVSPLWKEHQISYFFKEGNEVRFEDENLLQENYGMKYSETDFDDENLKKRIDISYQWDKSSFRLKSINEFLTKTSKVYLDQSVYPLKTSINNSKMKFYYKKDFSFGVPRIHSYFRFIYPKLRTLTANDYKINLYYINLLITEIDLSFEEARYSGNEIEISNDENGINLKISAYEDVFISIVKNIFDFLFDFKPIKYESIDYETRRFRNLEEKSLAFLSSVIKQKILNGKDERYFKDKYDFPLSTIENYAIYNSQHMYIECFAIGTINNEIEKEMHNLLAKVDVSEKSKEIEVVFEKKNIKEVLNSLRLNKEIEQGTTHLFKLAKNFDKEKEHFLVSFYQISKRTNEDDIMTAIFIEIFNEKTRENKISKVYKDDYIYLRLIIKSTLETPFTLSKNFIKEVQEILNTIQKFTEKEFSYYFGIVARQYQKSDLRLRHRAIKYWYEIYERTFDFERYDKIKKEISGANIKNTLSKFKKYALEKMWEKTRKIEFWLYHEDFYEDIEGLYNINPNESFEVYEKISQIY